MPLFPKKRGAESPDTGSLAGGEAVPDGESELASVTRRKEQALKKLGEMQFTAATNGYADQEQIDRLIREIQFLDEQIKLIYERRMKDMVSETAPTAAGPSPDVCVCGAPLSAADSFCRSCGNRRGAVRHEALDCAVCQHRIKPGSLYCSYCGARVIVPPPHASAALPRPVHVPPVEGRAFKMSVPPQQGAARDSGLGDWHEGHPMTAAFAGAPLIPNSGQDALRPPQIRTQWAAHLEPIVNPPQVDPGASMRLGVQLMRDGRFIEATDAFENASRMSPRDPVPRYQLGLVRYRMGDLEGAIGEFERALRINPNLPDAHNDLGLVLTKKGQVREAIHHFRKALQINPQHPDAHYNLGYACLSIGDGMGAATHLDMYLRIAPNAPDARTVSDVLMRLRQQTGG